MHLGWTLRELARRSGVAYQTLSEIERGANTKIDKLSTIARALACKITFRIAPEDKPIESVRLPVDTRARAATLRFVEVVPDLTTEQIDVILHLLEMLTADQKRKP